MLFALPLKIEWEGTRKFANGIN